jgi:hypothetical protein
VIQGAFGPGAYGEISDGSSEVRGPSDYFVRKVD